MTTSKDYIVRSLNELAEQFPKMKFRYEWAEYADLHFIEITPSVLFDNDLRYQKAEKAFLREFRATYPLERVSVLTDGAEYDLEKVTYEIAGVGYGLIRKTGTVEFYNNSVVKTYSSPKVINSLLNTIVGNFVNPVNISHLMKSKTGINVAAIPIKHVGKSKPLLYDSSSSSLGVVENINNALAA